VKISIITASYNSADTIECAIKSVLNQEYKDFEHIVIDGASTDGTVDILKKHPHLKWISEPDNGQVDAMQKGFAISNGEIIGNLNSDDYYLTGAFKSVLPLFKSGEKFVVGKVKVISEHNQSTWINDPAVIFDRMIRHWEPDAFCVNPTGYFYLRKVQEAVPFNLKNDDKHDLEFLLEAALKYRFKKIDKIFGVFSHVMNTKTFKEQIQPEYWKKDNFKFIDRLSEKMPLEDRKRFQMERERGYQLRRQWAIQDDIRSGQVDKMHQKGDLFFLPQGIEGSKPSRCGFVEFDRLATRGDWIVPILTIGKVASKAVYHTLKNLPSEVLPAEVYHIHRTSSMAIANVLPNRLPNRTETVVGSALRHLFERKSRDLKWKFIAGVREPIAAALSSVFENEVPAGQMEETVKQYAEHITQGFFNLNYEAPFGIDIYAQKFNHNRGYSIIRDKNVEVLIYRFEDLPRIFPQAIDEYLGIRNLELARINVSSQKDYAEEYKKEKEDFRIDGKFLKKIYSSRMVRHFYSDDEIKSFHKHWRADKKGTYRKKWNGLIYDIGMHTGEDTEFYLKKGYQVVAVEANPALVEAAQKKYAQQIASGQLVVLNLGIVDNPTREKLTFYINEKQTEWSSFVKKIALRDGGQYHCVKVDCTTLKDIVDDYGKTYYVKIDIEGNDHIALESLLSSEKLPKFVSVENGNMGMLTMLFKAGYDAFKYIQQNNIQKLKLPEPSKEGFSVQHSFIFGSSGPFGEETPGNWISHESVRKEIEKVWDPDGVTKNENHDDAVHGWFDLHARLSEKTER